jgi:hypothetical protein
VKVQVGADLKLFAYVFLENVDNVRFASNHLEDTTGSAWLLALSNVSRAIVIKNDFYHSGFRPGGLYGEGFA